MSDNEDQKCWAYDKQGRRCQRIAGHTDEHYILITWSDEDCWQPTAQPQRRTETRSEDTTQPETEKPAPKCAACSHSHKAGQCKCGCYNHIG